jgi:hypothetical protein
MKKLLIALFTLLILSPFASQAQSNGGVITFTNVPPNEQNFFQNALNWAGSRYESGLTWPTNDLDFAIGAAYSDNIQWANTMSVEKNIGKFYVGAEMDNAGVAGVIVQSGGRAGYTISNSGDLRVQTGAFVGYKTTSDFNGSKGGLIQPEITLQKLLPGSTYAEFGLNWPLYFHGAPSSFPGLKLAAGAYF